MSPNGAIENEPLGVYLCLGSAVVDATRRARNVYHSDLYEAIRCKGSELP